jgi:hypothetical protein
MTSNSGQEITNLLTGLIGLLWIIKIWFHYSYLQTVDSRLREKNFISFFVNPENLLKSLHVVAPFIFSPADKGEESEIKRKRTITASYILWTTFALTSYFLIKYPPTNETEKINYDLTK